MIRTLMACFGLFAAVTLAGPASGQDTFTLGFDGPDSIEGDAGATVTDGYFLTLGHEGEGPGAQGWSYGVVANGGTITQIQTGLRDGDTITTDAGTLFDGGFQQTELASADGSEGDCEGKDGAISAFVLSLLNPVEMPINETRTIAWVEIETSIPSGGGAASLTFVSGCRGSGRPVDTAITQAGGSADPVVVPKEIALVETVGPPPSCCDEPLLLGYSDEVQRAETARTGILGLGEECLGADGATSTSEESATVYATISDAGSGGVAGWSMSIEVADGLNLTAATTEGTPGHELQSGGFDSTQVVDPTAGENNGRQGAVTAVVLSLLESVALPIPGSQSVLALTVTPSTTPGEGETVSGSLRFVNGMQGAGRPVENVLTVNGASAIPCNFNEKTGEGSAKLVVSFTGAELPPPPPPTNVFLRGDSNDDTKVNIADPIWTISEVFRKGPRSPCFAAGDSNDDGMVDLSDAMYTLNYRFLKGDLPSAPFPECGEDPTPDELDCGGESARSPSCR